MPRPHPAQRAMGHASATTTLGTYAHLWPTAEDTTRAAASGMAAAVLATRPENQADPSNSDSASGCHLIPRVTPAAVPPDAPRDGQRDEPRPLRAESS